MRPGPIPLDGGEAVAALVTDRYLDELLAANERSGDREAGRGETVGTSDADVRRAGDVVHASLVRVHPSFRFEERLASRLASLAATGGRREVAGGVGQPADVIALTSAVGTVDDPLLDAVLAGELDPADEAAIARAAGVRSPTRPLIVTGAITSAAISLVGVAWVAWRASRPWGAQRRGGGAARSALGRNAMGHVAQAGRLAAELAGSLPGGRA